MSHFRDDLHRHYLTHYLHILYCITCVKGVKGIALIPRVMTLSKIIEKMGPDQKNTAFLKRSNYARNHVCKTIKISYIFKLNTCMGYDINKSLNI